MVRNMEHQQSLAPSKHHQDTILALFTNFAESALYDEIKCKKVHMKEPGKVESPIDLQVEADRTIINLKESLHTHSIVHPCQNFPYSVHIAAPHIDPAQEDYGLTSQNSM
ncbi:hypothetical protein ACFE04_030628 [Oxalis oulophora]